jgi:tRNA pseudouridine38-40 synthase
MSKNIVLLIAYDGTRYLGWQKTHFGLSIEQELEDVLTKILQHPVELQAASRTDRGVHAEGQVVNFFTPKKEIAWNKLLRGCNGLLPEDIRVLAALEAPHPQFHPTLETKAKCYRYSIARGQILWPLWRTTHWHIPFLLDVELMKKASALLIGTHDFAGFRNQRKQQEHQDTSRTVTNIDIQAENERLEIIICGESFLYKMVRNIVGALVYVGLGKMTLEELASLLEQPDRTANAVTAPACGLTLCKVYYDCPPFCHS